MRADVIARVIDKLDPNRAAKAIEALKAQPSEAPAAERPELPDQAAGDMPGRPETLPEPPNRPDLPPQAMGAAGGRPSLVPHSRPEPLPDAAADFCEETGLPMVAMADARDEEDCDEVDLV